MNRDSGMNAVSGGKFAMFVSHHTSGAFPSRRRRRHVHRSIGDGSHAAPVSPPITPGIHLLAVPDIGSLSLYSDGRHRCPSPNGSGKVS